MAGKQCTLYFAWDRSAESGKDLGILENRYPALFEFRRAIWPNYEHTNTLDHDQGIAGFLDHVVLFDFKPLMREMKGFTQNEVRLLQREAEGQKTPIMEAVDGTDLLIVVSLDHLSSDQAPTDKELEAISEFLARDDATLVVSPHHDIGADDRDEVQLEEFMHHGDRLVPAQQRIGGYARALLAGLGLDVDPRFGLSPALEGGNPAPLRVFPDRDDLGILKGVSTFNAHPHLPHLAPTLTTASGFRILAKQLIRADAESHPFTRDGNSEFNAFLWAPPKGERRGNVFVCDATLWSSAFGGQASLRCLWRNLALM